MQRISIADIKPNGYNPNVMYERRYEALKRAIESSHKAGNGILQPLLVNKVKDKYIIIDGEHRYKACVELGITEVDCIVISIPEREMKALTLQMNRLHGENNKGKLTQLLQDMVETQDDVDYLLNDITFDIGELNELEIDWSDFDLNFGGDIIKPNNFDDINTKAKVDSFYNNNCKVNEIYIGESRFLIKPEDAKCLTELIIEYGLNEIMDILKEYYKI